MWRQSFLFVVALAITVNGIIHSPPQIIKQPPTDEMLYQVPQVGETDKPFVIECEAEGEPAPTYRWIKNGKPFEWQAYDNRITQQPGRGTLVVTHPRDEDLGQYQCFAENEHGTATSNSVFVRKAELNNFKDEPVKSVEVNEGLPYKLQCQPPDGWPKPNVFWLIQEADGGSIKTINNSRITLDPEGNLWFSNVTRDDHSDNFYYTCAATSPFRSEYKIGNRVLLNVIASGISPTQNRHEPVRQYVSRKNEVALRGKKIEMYCIYGGTPLPQIVWTKNGRSIPWSDRITQGHYGKSLIIKHTTFEDEGEYTCESSNGVGSAQSYSVSLKVKAVPYFTVEPETQNAAEEETVEFRCEATGIPEPTIKWIHNGKPIDQAPPNSRRTVSKNKIIIKNLEKKDTGNYGCNATNALGYVYKDVYLNVLALPPEITEAPRKEETVDRREVTMTCRVFGAPKPQVKWIRSGLELTGGRYTTLENGDLHIKDVQFSDAGDYTCHAENKFGTKEANGTLSVKSHTKITEAPADYEVAARTSATFRCNAIADPSLKLQVDWLHNGEAIDFDSEARFFKSSDYSLTISKAIELDSGTYTCLARTKLDNSSANATLTVQDVPNPPLLNGIRCNAHDAAIDWQPQGDNRSPILYFTIQYNTSFTPDSWDNAATDVPATEFTYAVPMSPWANYTFRVIAHNKIGPSLPSGHSEPCSTQPDVPYKNPENVEGKGTNPSNMIIKWTPMKEIDHNAPQFHYRVSWKRDIPSATYQHHDIYDWAVSEFAVYDLRTFEKYKIKVQALNEKGESNVAVKEVEGYSGEDKPLEAPSNLTLERVHSGTSALLQWGKVSPESVRGHFRGYRIQTWSEHDPEDIREIQVKSDATKSLVSKLTPFARNYARVMVFNDRFNGPPSNTIEFDTPEGVPSPVKTIEAYPLGSSAFLLKWKPPPQPNGNLNGYRIYYEEVNGTAIGTKLERSHHISDPKITTAKLAGLKSDTKYRLHVTATTKAGEGEDNYVEQKTGINVATEPDVPYFETKSLPTENGLANFRVIWIPNVETGKSGSHFFTKYRIKDDSEWITTDPELDNNFIDVRGLDPDAQYEFKVVAVDAEYMTESEPKIVSTYGIDGPIKVPSDNVATAGWFIGMMLAIAFLILILIIICIIKRNRGGKYDVHDRELANGRRDYPDEGGFHEYSQPLDNKSQGRQSLSSQKPGPESDTDSMAEYGDGEAGGQFAEDGSFIGQYLPGKLQPPVSPQPIHHPSKSQDNNGATYV